MSLFEKFDNFLAGVDEYLAKPIGHYCLPETSDDILPDALVAMNGSLCSLIRVDGLLNLLGAAEYTRIIERFTAALQGSIERQGHAIAFYFTRSPERGRRVAQECLAPSINQSKTLGIGLEGLYEDWADTLGGYLAEEQTLIAVWTTPKVMVKGELKRAVRARTKRLAKGPAGKAIQLPGLALDGLRDPHKACVSSVVYGLEEGGVVCSVLDAGEAIREIKASLFPDITGKSWRPQMFGDRIRLPARVGSDDTGWMYKRFREQIFTDDGVTPTARTLSLGGYLHNPVAVTLPPGEPESFAKLFMRLRRKNMSWRLAILLEGDGMSALGIKRTLARILHFTSVENKKFNRAVDQLEQLRLQSVPLVKLRMMADTWVRESGHDDQERIRDQADFLINAISTWGNAQATDVIGDPALGVAAATPGLMQKFPTVPACAPLLDASLFCPLTRPVSVWRQGAWPLRSYDGKSTPFQPGSSKQAAWIDAGVANMGGGKSVSLNALNLAFLMQPGLPEIPYLLVLDIGPSSRGIVSAVQANLPEDKKHLAVFKRLRMDPDEFAINPCDTELGCPYPTQQHRAFLVNLCALLATDPLSGEVPSGIVGLIDACVERAYTEVAPEHNPAPYEYGVEPEVDKAIEANGLELDANTTWWELVKSLFEAEDIHHASVAQRHAVPLLTKIGQVAQDPEIAQTYGGRDFHGEDITHYLARVLSVELGGRFPILVKPTRFEVRTAKVVALDLDEVAPKGSPAADHQTAVMYMVARFAGAQRFFLQDTDVKNMPNWIAAYHRDRIAVIRQIPKRLCFDEFHRVNRFGSAAQQIVADVDIAVRESRKWNLHIGIYSQKLTDIPDAIIDLLSSVFVFNAGNPREAKDIAEKLGLAESAQQAIVNLPPKPGASGAAMLGVFKTTSGRVVTTQVLTLGPQALWAFSTTAEDARLRDALYTRLGVARTLKELAARFPSGVQGVLELRRLEGDVSGRNLLKELEEEIVAAIKKAELNPKGKRRMAA